MEINELLSNILSLDKIVVYGEYEYIGFIFNVKSYNDFIKVLDDFVSNHWDNIRYKNKSLICIMMDCDMNGGSDCKNIINKSHSCSQLLEVNKVESLKRLNNIRLSLILVSYVRRYKETRKGRQII